MNGKIKTKFAALFAVALMITVCVVPVVGNEGTDAAPVSSSNGEVFEGYDITLYKEGGDYSGLVYCGVKPSGFSTEDWTCMNNVSSGNGYWINNVTKEYLLAEDIPGYEVTPETYGMPMVQFVFNYDQTDINPLDLSVTVGNDTKKTNVSDPNYVKPEKKQGIITIALGEPDEGYKDNEMLKLPEAAQVGNFDVEVTAKQGVTKQVIKKTINAGEAVTVSGSILDADKKPIKSLYDGETFETGLTVKYIIDDGSEQSTNVNSEGKYNIQVAKNAVVTITDIVDSTGAYTFEADSDVWGFGTVSKSVTKDFSAKEKTGTITLVDAGGKSITDVDAEATFQWFEEKEEDDKYIINSLDVGKAKMFYNNGSSIIFAYSAPTSTQLTSGYKAYLIASADGDDYSFNAVDFDDIKQSPAADDDIEKKIKNKLGTDDVTDGKGQFKAKEVTTVVSIEDAGSKALNGLDADIVVYSEVENDETYTIAEYLTSVDKIAKSVNTVTFIYVQPVNTADTTYYVVAKGIDSGATEDYLKFTFDVEDITSTASDDDVEDAIKDFKGMAIVNSNKATVKAEQEAVIISGTVSDITEVVDDGAIINDTKVDIGKEGKFSLEVIKGTIVEVVLDSAISDIYSPDGFYLGTVTTDVECSFTKIVDNGQKKSVKYKVDGLSNGVDVEFTYSINGKTAKSTEKADANGVALLQLYEYVGSSIEVSATAENYQISALDGYYVKAIGLTDYYFKAISDEDGIAGATFNLTYEDNKEDITLALTADKDGIVKVTLPSAVYSSSFVVSKDGKVIEDVLTNQTFYVGLEKITTGRTVDLGTYYSDAVAKVSIKYGAVYNVEDVSYGPVAYEPLVGYTASTNNVVDSIALKAPSIDNFEFVAWMVDGVVVSESADYTLVVEDGEVYEAVALYSAVHYEEPAEGLSMNVLVIGIVILILGILAVAYGIISKKQ